LVLEQRGFPESADNLRNPYSGFRQSKQLNDWLAEYIPHIKGA